MAHPLVQELKALGIFLTFCSYQLLRWSGNGVLRDAKSRSALRTLAASFSDASHVRGVNIIQAN